MFFDAGARTEPSLWLTLLRREKKKKKEKKTREKREKELSLGSTGANSRSRRLGAVEKAPSHAWAAGALQRPAGRREAIARES